MSEWYVDWAPVRVTHRVKPITLGNSSSFSANDSSLTWSHTVAVDSNILIVCVSLEHVTTVTGITYAGEALTKLRHDVYQLVPEPRTEIWYKVNPTIGVNNVVVTLGAVARTVCGARDYGNTDGIDAHNGSDGDSNSITVNVTTTNDACQLIGVIAAMGEPVVTDFQDQLWNASQNGSPSGRVRGHGSERYGALAGTRPMKWTLDSAEHWAASIAALKPLVVIEQHRRMLLKVGL